MGSVREWYSGKNILISGGTGFMGKVLIEKILRSIPNVGTIYVLSRAKRGLTPSQRIANFAKLPLFAPLLSTNPKALNKVVPVEGDISEEQLGIKPEIMQELLNKVNIIFNVAASLKLEAGLKESVNFNVKGTQRMLELASNVKNLQIFAHFSTAFCHCEQEILEEKAYKPRYSPHDIVSATDWMSDSALEVITPTLLGQHPNCYTFTKQLSEALVVEYAHKFPAIILRPSIVVPSLKEPVPGWVDSLNGPVGALAAAGKGLLRSMLCRPETTAEVIPVDIAINAALICTYNKATSPRNGEISVYNSSSSETFPITWGELVTTGKKVIVENPFDAGLWYPGGTIRTNPVTHAIMVFLCQTIPAYFIDFILFLTRNKRFMVHVQNRIKSGMKLLQYFTMRQWNFTSEKCHIIFDQLQSEEKEIFYLRNVPLELNNLLKDAILGSRQYCMKEPLENLPRARRQLKLLYLLDKGSQLCLLMLIGWLMLKYLPILHDIMNSFLPDISKNTLTHKIAKT